MIKVKLLHEGQVVKKISSRIHESVILEQIKNFQKPFDEIVIVEGDLSEDAKDILKKVAKKVVPAAMAAGVALGGAGQAQAYPPGMDRSIGQHLSDIFSPNYQEIVRQRKAERDTERRAWDAKQAEIRRAKIERAREEGRAEGQGISGREMSGNAQVYDQARLSQDGKYYNLYDLNHNVIRVPVEGTEFVPGDSQRLSHYITRSGRVYYVRHTPQTTQAPQPAAPQEGLQEDPVVDTIPASGGTSQSTMKSTGTKSVGQSVVAPATKPGSKPTPGAPAMAGQPDDQENALTLDKNHGLDQKTLDDLARAGIMVTIKEKGRAMSNLEKRIRGVNESIEVQYLKENQNPMAQAVAGRIVRQHADWLSQFGVEAVLQAIDDVTEGEGEWEEIGSSDVSAYVKMVADRLQDRMGGRDDTESALKSRWNLGSSLVSEIKEEFGANYAAQLAQKIYDENPRLDTSDRADEVLDAAYEIAKQELSPKRAHYLFAYDEDFAGDLVSAYAVLQQGKGVAEDSNTNDRTKQVKVFKDRNGNPIGEIGIDLDASPGNDDWYCHHYATGYNVLGFENAAEARRELQYVHKHPEEVNESVSEARHFRTAYGWAGGHNEKTGKRYKHPEQVSANREAKKQEKDQEEKQSVRKDQVNELSPTARRLARKLLPGEKEYQAKERSKEYKSLSRSIRDPDDEEFQKGRGAEEKGEKLAKSYDQAAGRYDKIAQGKKPFQLEAEVNEGVNAKQIKKDLDAGMSYDAVIGKHANKRMTNTDEIRRVIQQHAWEKRMKRPKEQGEQSISEGFTDPKLQAVLDQYEDSWRAFKAGGEVDENPDFYDAVFGYFTDSGEMPYEVARARTGDPIEWITDRLDILAGNEEVTEADMDDLEATAADQAAADKNIIMQIRKAADYEQPTRIDLADGSRAVMAPDIAHKLLTAFDRMRPDSKDMVQQMLNTQKGFNEIVSHLGSLGVQESLRPGEYHLARVTLDDGSVETVKIYWDEGFREQLKKQFARQGKTIKDIEVDWGVRQDFHEQARQRVARIMSEVFGL